MRLSLKQLSATLSIPLCCSEVRHHLKLVIPTGAQRSGGTCCAPFPQTTARDSVHPSLLQPRCATTSNLSSRPERSEVEGPAVRLSLKQLPETLPIPLCYSRGAPPPQTLSSRPERSEVEGPAVLPFPQTTASDSVHPSLLKLRCATTSNFVIPTGAQRSGGTCCAPFPQTTAINSIDPSRLKLRCATKSNFVIPTGAEGPAVRPSPKQLPSTLSIPICSS